MCNIWKSLDKAISLVILAAAGTCGGQVHKQSTVLHSDVDRHTAVSFFCFGDMWTHWRDPMNFYVADVADARLHKVELSDSEGAETWITPIEMEVLLKALAQSDFDWTETKEIKPFGTWMKRQGGDWLQITVLSKMGTADAQVRLTRMCDSLGTLDGTMPTPRILWQFQTLRWDDGCRIAGYHNELRPEN